MRRRSTHQQERCRALTRKLIKNGTLTPTACEVCGNPKVDVHHEDYDDPANVKFLCDLHHKRRHKEINAAFKPNTNGVLAKWVRTARGPRGLRAFSALTGCSISHLSQMETGKLKNPELGTLAKIAKASEGRCNAPVLTINIP